MIKTYKKLIVAVFLLLVAAVGFAFAPSCVTAEAKTAKFDIEPNQRVLTVIMYHQILKNPKKPSEFVVTPAQFEQDLIELKKKGFVTVLPSEVIKFAEGKGDLPLKPILITFDDGNYNNIFYGEEILTKYNCKAVFNVIGAFSEYSTTSGDHSKPNYSHMTWEQVENLNKNELFEIGNHTYNLHKFKPRYGIKRKEGESDEVYKEQISADILRMQKKLADVGVKAECFAYPFGRFDKTSKDILAGMGFKMIFTCNQQQNVIQKGKPEILLSVNRYNRHSAISTRDFFEKIDYELGK
jgi:peptidoglycan/xylan/chitin deacetylase (PgdA/CDA1 family)